MITASLNTNKQITFIDGLKFCSMLCVIFLLPTKGEWFRYYTIINCVFPFLLFSSKEYLRNKRIIKMLFCWVVVFLFSLSMKSFFIPEIDFNRELTELFRIIVLIPILLVNSKFFSKKGFQLFYYFSVFYVFVNSYLVLAERSIVAKNSFYFFVQKRYHVDIQIGLSYLAKGLMSHGAVQSLVMCFFTIFFILTIKYVRFKSLNFILILLCTYNMLSGGSRTNIVALAFFIIIYYGNVIFKERLKMSIYMWLYLLIIFLSFSYLISTGMFGKLSLLIEKGTNVSSIRGRQRNWGVFLEIVYEKWYLFAIGWGKSIFINKKSFFTDNDYFTYFLVHGFFVTSTLIFFLISFLKKQFFSWKKSNVFEKILFYTIFLLLIISTSSVGFSHPIMLLSLMLMSKFSKENNFNS